MQELHQQHEELKVRTKLLYDLLMRACNDNMGLKDRVEELQQNEKVHEQEKEKLANLNAYMHRCLQAMGVKDKALEIVQLRDMAKNLSSELDKSNAAFEIQSMHVNELLRKLHGTDSQ